LIRSERFSTWGATKGHEAMKADTEKVIGEIKQVLSLLRRHL
jgi:hypothetical protein